ALGLLGKFDGILDPRQRLASMTLRANLVIDAVLQFRIFDHAMQQAKSRQSDRIVFLPRQSQPRVGALLGEFIIAVIEIQVAADQMNPANTMEALIMSVNGF